MKNDYVVVTFKLDVKKINKLKEIAREISYKQGRDVSYTDLVREAISEKISLYESKR